MRTVQKKIAFTGLLMLLVVGYFGLWASDMYVSEARFSLRSQEGGGPTELFAIFGQASGGTGADSYVVTEYIKSIALLNILESELSIKAHYQNPKADIFSRLKAMPTQEEFATYFLRQVTIRFDPSSGILMLQVRAFTPQAAQDICRQILLKSEELVNRLSLRAIEGRLLLSREEISRAEQRLGVARSEMRLFREAHNLLDPIAEAGTVQSLVAELEGSAAKARTELAVARSYMKDNSAKVNALKTHVKALEDQIIKEKIRLTGQGQNTINALGAEYEQLLLEYEFAQKQFLLAMNSQEAARIRAESQNRYLVAFVEPSLPEEALRPRRIYSIIVSLLGILLVFSLVSLIVAAVREHTGG